MPAIFAKKSPFTGLIHTVTIPYYSQDEFDVRYNAWKDGRMIIQEAFPDTPADLREFIKTGITPEEWYKFVGTD